MLRSIMNLLAVGCLFATHGESAAVEVPSIVAQLMKQSCLECHNDDTQEGNLNLATRSFELADPNTFAVWTKVYDRVRDGEMPPKSEIRPTQESTDAFVTELGRSLHAADTNRQSTEGRALARRLNRDEYQNTLRDLLGVEKDYRPLLPEDGRALGFDKVGSALSVSAEHLQAYMTAAREALDEAIVTGPSPKSETVRYPQRWDVKHFGKDFFRKNSKGFGNQPDAIVRFGDFVENIVGFRGAPTAGTYRFRVRARAWGGETVKARIRAGDKRYSNTSWLVTYTEFPPEGAEVEVTTYLREKDTLRVSPIGIAGPGTMHRANGFIDANTYQGPGLAIEWVEVEGPLHETWPPPSHHRLFGDLDFDTATQADAERMLREFLPRAFRRPVGEEEVHHYSKIFAKAAINTGFLAGIKVALQAALCSPYFLYLDAPVGTLDDYALASRLAYFLWSSTPDDELIALAAKGELHQAEVLRVQVERLLKDPKAVAFNEGFTGQWLDLRKITATTPDDRLYPEWDELIEWSSLQETRRFFDEMLVNNLSVTNFVQSDFAILNERLAEHYGIAGVKGISFRKVPLPIDSVRGGVLGQASVLKVTANGTTSSPVLRGVWVQERILGKPVPPPPPGVPAVEPDIRGATTIREQLNKHRNIESCATCHAKIDAPGFALESFDVIGGWRERYRSASENTNDKLQITRPLTFDAKTFLRDPTQRGPLKTYVGLGPVVDASGQMPNGESFANYNEFRRSLLAAPDQLARSLTQHLVTYATGTGPQYADRVVINQIVDRVHEDDYGFRSLIHEIVQSPIFLNQ
jgi:mono/diheme cytochrome c family protein